jgi:hypothetical protein
VDFGREGDGRVQISIDHGVARRSLESFGVRVEFFYDPIDDLQPATTNLYTYCTTDQVRFFQLLELQVDGLEDRPTGVEGRGGTAAEHDRAAILKAIGPFWDGNEVWLVVFVGALFGAFPEAYATALSAFDPTALARVNKQLQQAEETRRGALRECAMRLLHSDPAAASALWAPGQTGETYSSEGAQTKPSTTGGSIRGVVRQLRQTRMLVERVQETAAELTDLAHRPGVPEAIRRAATASASAVETAMVRFRQELTDAEGEAATEAARIALEQAVGQIFADYRQIQIALAALPGGPTPPAPPAPGSQPETE